MLLNTTNSTTKGFQLLRFHSTQILYLFFPQKQSFLVYPLHHWMSLSFVEKLHLVDCLARVPSQLQLLAGIRQDFQKRRVQHGFGRGKYQDSRRRHT